MTWLFGDVVAGVTVGFVVIPQGMAYALLAKLPPEYGLYTSFVGFILYWAFATSKDITIGTVAVMSTIVGNIVTKIQEKDPGIDAVDIARALSVIAGSVLLFLGLTRLGRIVERVIIDTLKGLGRTKLDAAMGLSALVMLYSIRFVCNFMSRKQPSKQKLWFFVSITILTQR